MKAKQIYVSLIALAFFSDFTQYQYLLTPLFRILKM